MFCFSKHFKHFNFKCMYVCMYVKVRIPSLLLELMDLILVSAFQFKAAWKIVMCFLKTKECLEDLKRTPDSVTYVLLQNGVSCSLLLTDKAHNFSAAGDSSLNNICRNLTSIYLGNLYRYSLFLTFTYVKEIHAVSSVGIQRNTRKFVSENTLTNTLVFLSFIASTKTVPLPVTDTTTHLSTK